MIIKTKFCRIEMDIVFIFITLTSIISNTLFKFLYYFFACYLFILFHESMHILVGSILDKKLIKIKLSISGVCASFEKEKFVNTKRNHYKNIIVYLSGPASNLILAFIFRDNIMIKEINVFLALLNLLPVFPLDGYNILFNMLRILFSEIKTNKIINAICNITFIILLVISIYQMIEYYNFSILIFCIYIYVLKIIKNNE